MSTYNRGMSEELKNLQAAIVMFTRLPLPSKQLHDKHFQQAPCYLPLVGIILACISILIYLSANLFLSTETSTLLALISVTLLTGAIHEDGFADCCDGFLAVPNLPRTESSVEKILTIMKDSRLGTFAVLGLITIFLTRWQLFDEIPNERHIIAFLSLYSLSKLPALIIMWKMPYVKSAVTQSKMTDATHFNVTPAAITAFITLALLLPFTPPLLLLSQCFTILLLSALLIFYFDKRLGGYNGDCLGASEQISGLILLLVFAFYF